ncbi:MAG TPA: hypothetical protein VGG56_11435 [Terracidiphilus sp.]|jgi:hypothetical protein
MKGLTSVSSFSVGFAFAALVVGLRAAQYWLKASKVDVVPVWPDGPQALMEPVEPEQSQRGWITATIEAVKLSSDLNKRAARWTAAAVILSAVSSVLGALAGSF